MAHGSGRDCALARVPLAALLEEARPRIDAVDVVFGGLDRGVEGGIEQQYERSLPLAEALDAGGVLAFEMNGVPLPPQHGFPLRLVVPGWYGMTNVKWLTTIRVDDQPFDGYQVAHAYRFRQAEDEEGRPVTRMRPRSLMVPPGVPDFFSRERVVAAGTTVLEGQAWSGRAPVVRVEVSTDAGTTWVDATLGDELGAWAWRGWSLGWEATPGSTSSARGRPTRRGDPAARAGVEPRRLREQRRPAGPGRRPLTRAEPRVGPERWHHPGRWRADARVAPRHPVRRGGHSRGACALLRADGNTHRRRPRLPRARAAVLGVLASIGLVGLAVQERSPGRIPAAAFVGLAPVGFVVQEHVERLVHTGDLPFLPDEPRVSPRAGAAGAGRARLPPRRAPRRRHVGSGPRPPSARDPR